MGKVGRAYFYIFIVDTSGEGFFGNDMPKPGGLGGAGGIHQHVGDIYSCEETLAIKYTRDLAIIPHSGGKQSTYLQMALSENKFG